MNENKFDFYKYMKIVLGLFILSILVIVVSVFTMGIALADEIESELQTEAETSSPAESEPETIYSDGTLALTPDGTIIEIVEDETNESQIDVSGAGDSKSFDVLPETDQMDAETVVSDGSVSSGSQQTEISDSTVLISDSTVLIQPLASFDDESNVAALGSADVISLPEDRCISYEVMFNGTAYTAIFPLSAADSLAVSDGVLLNVGSSAVTGRLFKNSFDTGTYGQWYITLNSVLAANGNTNAYRYGSWSYLTAYSPYSGTSQTNLSSDVTYGNFYVVEEPAAFSDFDTFEVILLSLVVIGIVITIIDTVRKERRY